MECLFVNMQSIYSELDRIFSKAAPVYDSKIQANFINRLIRKKEVATILKYSNRAENFLEIGCGTGEESKRIALFLKENINLTLVDISPVMVESASNKIKSLGLNINLKSNVMKASEIGNLGGVYDMVYTLNGPLNTEPNIEEFFQGLEKITVNGSYFIAVLRNRKCMGEKLLYSTFRKSNRPNERNSESQGVEVVGEMVPTKNYGVAEFLNLVPDSFDLVRYFALGVTSPPYLAEKFNNKISRTLITATENTLCKLPILRNYGDQTLYVFRRGK